MATEVEFIQRSIRNHLEDLHTLFTNDYTNIDVEYYNEINLALLEAETAIEEATKRHLARMEKAKEYANNTRSTVS